MRPIAPNCDRAFPSYKLKNDLSDADLEALNNIDPSRLDYTIMRIGIAAEYLGVDEERFGALLNEAHAFTIGFQEAELSDANRIRLLDEADAEIEAYKNGKKKIVEWQLETLAARIHTIRDFGEVYGKSTAPVADAFQKVYDQEKQLHDAYLSLIDTQFHSQFAQAETEDERLSLTYKHYYTQLGMDVPEGFDKLSVKEQGLKLKNDLWVWHTTPETIELQSDPRLQIAGQPDTFVVDNPAPHLDPEEFALLYGQLEQDEARIHGGYTGAEMLEMSIVVTFLVLGFIPVVGQMATVAEIIFDLTRGDPASAVLNFAWGGLDDINDLRRMMRPMLRRSRQLADGAENLYGQLPSGTPDVPDVSAEAAKLRRYTDDIDDALGSASQTRRETWSINSSDKRKHYTQDDLDDAELPDRIRKYIESYHFTVSEGIQTVLDHVEQIELRRSLLDKGFYELTDDGHKMVPIPIDDLGWGQGDHILGDNVIALSKDRMEPAEIAQLTRDYDVEFALVKNNDTNEYFLVRGDENSVTYSWAITTLNYELVYHTHPHGFTKPSQYIWDPITETLWGDFPFAIKEYKNTGKTISSLVVVFANYTHEIVRYTLETK